MNRSHRHLPAYRRRIRFAIEVIWNAVGVAVLLVLAYALVVLANDILNGGV